jgi:hypothetical protein
MNGKSFITIATVIWNTKPTTRQIPRILGIGQNRERGRANSQRITHQDAKDRNNFEEERILKL